MKQTHSSKGLVVTLSLAALWGVPGVAGLVGCGGAQNHVKPLPPPPAKTTRATLAGPLCDAQSCRCRTRDADAGVPGSTAVKRFEVKVGPVDNEMWVQVGSMVLYKSSERATECFYVDLTAGETHAVTLRAKRSGGFGARVSISEQGAKGPWWFDTFEFACGGPGTCDKGSLRDFKARASLVKRHLFDPCGSTKVRNLAWQKGRMPDAQTPEDLEVRLDLQVYDFAPKHAPDSAECKKKRSL